MTKCCDQTTEPEAHNPSQVLYEQLYPNRVFQEKVLDALLRHDIPPNEVFNVLEISQLSTKSVMVTFFLHKVQSNFVFKDETESLIVTVFSTLSLF